MQIKLGHNVYGFNADEVAAMSEADYIKSQQGVPHISDTTAKAIYAKAKEAAKKPEKKKADTPITA